MGLPALGPWHREATATQYAETLACVQHMHALCGCRPHPSLDAGPAAPAQPMSPSCATTLESQQLMPPCGVGRQS